MNNILIYMNQLDTDLKALGNYLLAIATGKKLSLREIAKATGLSVNSVKVVFSGGLGTLKTYEAVCNHLGTSFCQAVIVALNTQAANVQAGV